MKATGIVRRIDDLGRVVVPKEIRRTLKIREGDPIEILPKKTENNPEKIFANRGNVGICETVCGYSCPYQRTYSYNNRQNSIVAVSGAGKRTP